MLILALDTTTRGGSCALARDAVVLAERPGDTARSQESQLPGELMDLLQASGVALSAIDLFAVATGPGSFTGLRVGIAAMQGLAFATGKPLVGVSALDALASLAGPGCVATWVDAWRGDVYASLYDRGHVVADTTVERPESILARLAAADAAPACESYTFIGDAVTIYRDRIVATLGDRARLIEPSAPLLAGAIARLAISAAAAGELPPPHAIRPLYVRRPDALLARDARRDR